MSDRVIRPRPASTPFTSQPAGRGALLAECLASVLLARPLPEAVRPCSSARIRPASCDAGIAAILCGARATSPP